MVRQYLNPFLVFKTRYGNKFYILEKDTSTMTGSIFCLETNQNAYQLVVTSKCLELYVTNLKPTPTSTHDDETQRFSFSIFLWFLPTKFVVKSQNKNIKLNFRHAISFATERIRSNFQGVINWKWAEKFNSEVRMTIVQKTSKLKRIVDS